MLGSDWPIYNIQYEAFIRDLSGVFVEHVSEYHLSTLEPSSTWQFRTSAAKYLPSSIFSRTEFISGRSNP
jgi:hypothetical protein